MYAEQCDGGESMEVDGDVGLFFLSMSEFAHVNLEDGRVVQVDMHGNFYVLSDTGNLIQRGAFNG